MGHNCSLYRHYCKSCQRMTHIGRVTSMKAIQAPVVFIVFSQVDVIEL